MFIWVWRPSSGVPTQGTGTEGVALGVVVPVKVQVLGVHALYQDFLQAPSDGASNQDVAAEGEHVRLRVGGAQQGGPGYSLKISN